MTTVLYGLILSLVEELVNKGNIKKYKICIKLTENVDIHAKNVIIWIEL